MKKLKKGVCIVILYMPLVSCHLATPLCNIVDVNYTGTESVSSVEGENVKTSVTSKVLLDTCSRSAIYENGITINVDSKTFVLLKFQTLQENLFTTLLKQRAELAVQKILKRQKPPLLTT
mgnify:CR=1 FL=1